MWFILFALILITTAVGRDKTLEEKDQEWKEYMDNRDKGLLP